MKKLVIVMMALAVSSAVFAVDVDSAREAAEAARAIENGEARRDAMDAAGAEFGPAVLAKLRAGEEISDHESSLLNWHLLKDDSGGVDLDLLREVLEIHAGDTIHNQGIVITLARQPGVTDSEIIGNVHNLHDHGAANILRRRSWDTDEGRQAFIAEWIAPRLAQGDTNSWYRNVFRRYAQDLSAADALPVLEDEIRGALTVEASPERDEWIKELRAQRVVLRDLAED